MLDFSFDSTVAPGHYVGASPRTGGAERRRGEEHELIHSYLPLAESIARRFTSHRHEAEDLRQVAYLGLVKAARRFDPDREVPFANFAAPTIAGEVKRYLRDGSWLVKPSRHVHEVGLAVVRSRPALEQSLGRTPTRAELADFLETDVATIADAARSLGGMFGANAADLDSYPLDSADGEADQVVLAADLRRAMRTLSARERQIVYLRFYEDRTEREIGEVLGVSQMQVSRLLSRIKNKLKTRLGDKFVEPPPWIYPISA